MSDPKFTQGPWTAKYESSLPLCMTIRGGKNNIPIAYVAAFVPTNAGEDYADGRLIAAAPEMYAMLEAIAKEMGDCRILLRGQSIQDLLAKARGEK